MPKVTRNAFLYLEPKPGQEEDFAQCGTCRMFVPEEILKGEKSGEEEQDRCIIHGSKVGLDEDDSCGFWVAWPTPGGEPVRKVQEAHADELRKEIPGSVTPEESGLVDRKVQCHRCEFSMNGATKCGLYEDTNRGAPDRYNLDTAIKPHACCNAQEPKSRNAKRIAQAMNGY